MNERRELQQRVERELGRDRLSFIQRQKHLERLMQAAERDDSMDFLKRRNRLEFAALATAIVVIVFGAIVWTTLQDADDPPDAELSALEAAQATLTAQGAAANPPGRSSSTSTVTGTRLGAGGECLADSFATDLPSLIPQFYDEHANWYGSFESGLWASPAEFTVFVPDGFEEADEHWFAGTPTAVLWAGTALPVTLTGEQLDGDGVIDPVESRDQAGDIQWTDASIPTPGCWELTGTTGDASLTLTVEVFPIEFRPDFQIMVRLNEVRPYDPPSTCSVSPVTDLDIRGESTTAHYWFESDEFLVESVGWYVAGEQQHTGVYGADVADGLRMTARSLDVEGGPDFEATTASLGPDGQLASYVFPTPGCWELELETPTTSTVLTVYVYPEECLPILQDGNFLVSCEEP